MAKSPYFTIADLRGGINDSDSPFALAANQVVEAKNVDFREGMIATKRKGMTPFSMTNSVFARDLPLIQNTVSGGFTGAASGNITVPAGVDDDGTGNTNHMLIVKVATKAATDVTNITLGAATLTLVDEQTSGAAGRLEVWRLKNPSLAGGTLTVTLAGAADCSIIAERWIRVDNVADVQNVQKGTGNSTSLSAVDVGHWNPQFHATMGFAFNFAAGSSVGQNANTYALAQNNGSAFVVSHNQVGQKPQTTFYTTFTAILDWVFILLAVKGRAWVAGVSFTKIRSLMRHTPTNDPAGDELWAVDNFGRIDRSVGGAWQTGVPVASTFNGLGVSGTAYCNGISLHGKFFLALDGTQMSINGDGVTQAVNVLQLWDGSVLRFAGLTAPAAFTSVVDTAGAGTFSNVRYYRYRLVEKVGGVVVRRSEPSPVFTFTPSGTKTGSVMTPVPLVAYITTNGGTDFEFEASVDNTLFYRILTQGIGVGTASDTTAYNGTSTYTAFPLSENVGEYTRPKAPRHVTVDGDRLILGGNVMDAVLDSRIEWTVLRGDNGVGNDERVPVTSRFFVDIDALKGGGITFLSGGTSGAVYAFKRQQIHKLVRTGTTNKAYDTVIESEQRGCLNRAADTGIDEDGLPAVYFTDQTVGLCRFGLRGVEDLSQLRRLLVQRINKSATTAPARVLFYPKHWLVWVAVALDAANVPNYLLCYNIRTKSWTDYTGSQATMVGCVMYPNLSTRELRPYVGPDTVTTSVLCEADAGSDDDGAVFRGYVRTKPYQLGNLFINFTVMGAALMARGTFGGVLNVALLQNYNVFRKETEQKTLLSTTISVILGFDDATIAECNVVQFEVGDPLALVGSQLLQTWTLDELVFKFALADETTGS